MNEEEKDEVEKKQVSLEKTRKRDQPSELDPQYRTIITRERNDSPDTLLDLQADVLILNQNSTNQIERASPQINQKHK